MLRLRRGFLNFPELIDNMLRTCIHIKKVKGSHPCIMYKTNLIMKSHSVLSHDNDDCVLGQLDCVCDRAHGNLDLHYGVLGCLDLVDGIFMHLDLHDGVGEKKKESKAKNGKKDPRDGWPTLPPEFMETTTIQPEKDVIWRLACNSPVLI